MMAAAFLLTHIRLVGCATALLAALLFVGWAGRLVAQHRHDQALIAVTEQKLATAVETNQQTLAAFERYKAEAARAEAAILADARRAAGRAASVASIRSEVAHVALPPGPLPAVGPYTAAALQRLRQLRAAGDHPSAAGEAGDPARALGVPARSRNP